MFFFFFFCRRRSPSGWMPSSLKCCLSYRKRWVVVAEKIAALFNSLFVLLFLNWKKKWTVGFEAKTKDFSFFFFCSRCIDPHWITFWLVVLWFYQHQQQVASAVERAKQVTMTELNAVIGVNIIKEKWTDLPFKKKNIYLHLLLIFCGEEGRGQWKIFIQKKKKFLAALSIISDAERWGIGLSLFFPCQNRFISPFVLFSEVDGERFLSFYT